MRTILKARLYRSNEMKQILSEEIFQANEQTTINSILSPFVACTSNRADVAIFGNNGFGDEQENGDRLAKATPGDAWMISTR